MIQVFVAEASAALSSSVSVLKHCPLHKETSLMRSEELSILKQTGVQRHLLLKAANRINKTVAVTTKTSDAVHSSKKTLRRHRNNW